MKRNLTPLILLFISFSNSSWSETLTLNDLVENPSNGLFYKKFTTVPFTGDISPSSDEPYKGSIKDGKPIGLWEYYRSNGLLKAGRMFHGQEGLDGETLMLEEYFDDGHLSVKRAYRGLIPNGTWEFFYSDGQLERKENYKDGELHGVYEICHRNGQISVRKNFINGKAHGPVETYYKSGQLEFRYTYKNGKLDGVDEHFNEDGTLRERQVYKNGELIE